MKNLLNKINESISKGAKKAAYEFSYQTGIGWKYEEGDKYRDRLSREIQRYSPNISTNNKIARLSMSGGGHYLTDFAEHLKKNIEKAEKEKKGDLKFAKKLHTKIIEILDEEKKFRDKTKP